MKKGIETIMNKEICSIRFTWEDAFACMDTPIARLLESLPVNILNEIVNEATHSISKGVESGIMFDWEAVMNCAIDNADVLRPLVGKKVIILKDRIEGTIKSTIVHVPDEDLNEEEEEVILEIIDKNGNLYEAKISEIEFVDGEESGFSRDGEIYVNISKRVTSTVKIKVKKGETLADIEERIRLYGLNSVAEEVVNWDEVSESVTVEEMYYGEDCDQEGFIKQ